MYSIILCTYNRASLLEETIDTLLNALSDRLDYELLIIDNNSTDNTLDLIKKYESVLQLKYYYEEVQGLSNARNRGIIEAKGDILIFLDDDVEISQKWLDSIVEPLLKNKSIGVVGGRVIPHRVEVPDWLPRRFYWLVGVMDYGTIPKYVNYAPGGNMAIRKSILNEVGYFNPFLGRNAGLLLGGEEVELQSRIKNKGYKIFYSPQALIYHKIANKLNLEYVLRFAYLEGVSSKRIDKASFKIKYFFKSLYGLILCFIVFPTCTIIGEYASVSIRKKYFQGYLKVE